MLSLVLSTVVLQTSATAVSVVGRVEMRLGAETIALARSAEVPEAATVVTHERSTASLRLASGSLVRLGPETELVLRRLQQGSPAGRRREGFTVKVGRIWAGVMRLIGQESEFEVETPSAVAGVRGTAFFVSVEGDRASFVVDRGTLDISAGGRTVSLAGPGAEVVAGPDGLGVTARAGGPALDDLRRKVGGARAVLGGGYVGLTSLVAAPGAGGAGHDAWRRDLIGPTGLSDTQASTPSGRATPATLTVLTIYVQPPTNVR